MRPGTSSGDLIYVTGPAQTYVISYADGTLLQTLPNTAFGICSDNAGNVFIPNEHVWEYAHGQTTPMGRGLLCAFNFPFDASRCAIGYVESHDRFLGSFTFQFFQYRDKAGQLRAHPYRPGIAVKHMDSKRALKGLTGAIDPDKLDQIPQGGLKPKKGYVFRGRMLDLRTLAFALTDRSLSLEAACELFGVEHGKQQVEQHGIVTPE